MSEQKKKTEISEEVLEKLKEQIGKIQYGSITLVIHEGKIVQLDTAEKIRLT